MRQDKRTNVPEVGEPFHPYQVQGRNDGWSVFDASTGGWTGQFESFKAANVKAKELFEAKQAEASKRIQHFHLSRNGNPA
jgi:hypothetical protein